MATMSEGGLSASKIEIRGELQFAIEPKMATNQSIELHNKPRSVISEDATRKPQLCSSSIGAAFYLRIEASQA